MAVHLCPSCGWPLDAGFFDDARHAVVIAGKVRRPVPPMRWKLLSFFRAHPGQVLDHQRIYAAMYGVRDDPPEDNTLRVHISKLRQDLAGVPYEILTRAHDGYCYDLVTAGP